MELVHPNSIVYVAENNGYLFISTAPIEEGIEMTLYDFMETSGLSQDPDAWDEVSNALDTEGMWEL